MSIHNLFQRIFKQKRMLFFAVLLFIGIGFFSLPQETSAMFSSSTQDVIGAVTGSGSSNILANLAAMIAKTVIYLADKLVSIIAESIAQQSYSLYQTVTGALIKNPQWAITREFIAPNSTIRTKSGLAFLTSWNVVKDWANMVILIGLIGVAIATILRYQDYEAKKLLPKIIFAALMVNFSILFVGIVIDLSNVLMSFFINGNFDIIAHITNSWAKIVLPKESNSNLLGFNILFTPLFEFLAADVTFTILYILAAITLLWLSITLIQRYIILAMLFILSPLAFVFSIFPISRGIWNSWWQHFIKWCFIGLATSFFLRLTIEVLKAMAITTATTETELPSLILNLLVVMGFMIAGLRISSKASTPFTSAVIGLAKTATVGAVAASGAAVLWTARKAGGDKAVANVKNLMTQFGETQGFLTEGSTALQEQQRFQPDKGVATALRQGADRDQIMDIVKGSAYGDAQKAKRLEATQIAFERGYTRDLTLAQKIDYAKSYSAYGRDAEDLAKFEPDLAPYSKKTMDELKFQNPTKTNAELEKMAKRKFYPKRNTDHIDKMPEADYFAALGDKIASWTPGTAIDADGAALFERAAKENKLHKVSGSEPIKAAYLAQAETDYGISKNTRKSIEKADHKYKKYDTSRVDQILTSKGITPGAATPVQRSAAEEDAVKEQFKENLRSMSDGQLRDLLTTDLDTNAIKQLDPKRINAFDTAPQATRTYLRDTGPTSLIAQLTLESTTIRPTDANESKRIDRTIRALRAVRP